MDLKVISKNSVGAVGALILTILLSQARLFDFLIDTILGRMVLLLFILGISYANKILGVVSVLIVIIMFNQSNFGLMEGFENDETTITETTTTETNSSKDMSNNIVMIKNMTQQIKANEDELNKKKDKLKQLINEKKGDTSAKTTGGQEGFNTIDRELTILRGKRSNEVPVFADARTQMDGVEASDIGAFTSDYSSV